MVYPMPSYEELIKRAQACVDMKPRTSFVEDAVVFARFILDEHTRVARELVDTQRQCTELALANAQLRRKLGEAETPDAGSLPPILGG